MAHPSGRDARRANASPAAFLTWMILWMLRNARYLKAELHRRVGSAIAKGGAA